MEKKKEKLEKYLEAQNLAHVYCIEGGGENIHERVLRALSLRGIRAVGNPDLQLFHYKSGFGIEDARSLKSSAYQRPMVGNEKFFVLVFGTITHEAQNALLKLFEEPTAGTHFFLVVPTNSIFLPTVLSRLFLISLKREAREMNRAEAFVKASPRERLELIGDIVVSKDKVAAIDFLNELEVYLYESDLFRAGDEKRRKALSDIENARGYLMDRAPSVKMLLEHIALAI